MYSIPFKWFHLLSIPANDRPKVTLGMELIVCAPSISIRSSPFTERTVKIHCFDNEVDEPVRVSTLILRLSPDMPNSLLTFSLNRVTLEPLSINAFTVIVPFGPVMRIGITLTVKSLLKVLVLLQLALISALSLMVLGVRCNDL